MNETVKRQRIRVRTVEYDKRKRATKTAKPPPENLYDGCGPCTLILLMDHASVFEQDKIGLLRRALVRHYRRERGLGITKQSYRVWRREREKKARDRAMTALERAIVEAVT